MGSLDDLSVIVHDYMLTGIRRSIVSSSGDWQAHCVARNERAASMGAHAKVLT